MVKSAASFSLALVVLSILLFFPMLSLAAPNVDIGRPSGTSNVDVGKATYLKNPLKGIDSLEALIVKILDIVVVLGTYVAVIFIIWSGFLFVKAQGNPEALTAAKKTFFYTLIGVAILLGAKALAMAIAATLKNVVG